MEEQEQEFSFPPTKETPSLMNPLMARSTVVDRSGASASHASEPVPLNSASTSRTDGSMPPPPPRRGKIPLEKGYSQMDWMRLTRSNKDLSGQKGLRKDITMEEVQLHKSPDDAWTVLRGKVYNITPYMGFHPGGKAQLRRGAGIDCTGLFNKYHAWVNGDMMLEKCLIGFLAPASHGPQNPL